MNRFFSLLFLLSCLTLTAQDRSDTLHIHHYDIHLSVLDFQNRILEGHTSLSLLPKIDNLDNVVLDLAPFTVDSVKVDSRNVLFSHSNSRLTVSLPDPGNRGDTLSVEVFYHGVPEKDPRWGGFYFSGEYAFNMGVAFTRLPHNYGRCWFPCLDLFTDKSTYRCHVRTTSDKMAICGGVLSDTSHRDDGTIVWTWDLEQPVPSYLVSVAVGHYEVFRDTFSGMERSIPISVYVPPSRISDVPGSFANLKNILHFYEASFGPYAFDRVGYVGVNFNSGAMEHATNIAYPVSAINGNLNYQSLLTHELSHSWFGNLMTCQKAEEMWINEGFARYCEILTEEFLYPGGGFEAAAAIVCRDLHRTVLRSAHTDDGGYYALNAVPQEVTYGSTSYDKGGVIVHTLRHYLGDSLFFQGIKSVLQEKAFQTVSSPELFRELGLATATPLEDFYEAWIDQPGFLHFSIDSIRPSSTGSYKVYIRQRLYQALRFGNNNQVDITFFSPEGEIWTLYGFRFSGEYGIAEATLPFEPLFGVIDYYEKIADAVIDYNLQIGSSGNYPCSMADFTLTANRVSDTVRFRIEYNFVSPGASAVTDPDIYRISDHHYWRVEYIAPSVFEGDLRFRYAFGNSSLPDYSLIQGYAADDLVLLYRRNPSEDWRIIPSRRLGSAVAGYLVSDVILPGEYTLGVGNDELGLLEIEKSGLILYPNPATSRLQYRLSDDTPDIERIDLFNAAGKFLRHYEIRGRKGSIPVHDLNSGQYLLSFQTRQGNVTGKFIKE